MLSSDQNYQMYQSIITLTAGGISGGIEATTTWPMEFIKTQLQLQSKSRSKLPYNNILMGLTLTVRSTGIFSLYRGLAPTLLGSIPKAGLRFGGNAFLRDLLREEGTGKLSASKNLMAGMGAGICEALLIVAPVETIKTRCIERNMNFITGLQMILQTEGFQGVYQGATATVLKQASNQGLRFMWFHEYKRIVTDNEQNKMSALMGLLGGMSAGCFSALGNNPLDVIKTRMQGMQSSQYNNTLDCFYQIISKEGISAFYAGLKPRLARVIPGQGVIFMSFEVIQDKLRDYLIGT